MIMNPGARRNLHLDSSPLFKGEETEARCLPFIKDKKEFNPLGVCGSSKFQ